jgi:hypothetical protein
MHAKNYVERNGCQWGSVEGRFEYTLSLKCLYTLKFTLLYIYIRQDYITFIY